MCRLAAYFGPPMRLSALLTEPPHGLVHQSYAPREMTSCRLNADGWGVGWFAPGVNGKQAAVLKGTLPIWSDENVEGVAPAVESSVIVAAVRSATPGLGVCMANTPPYRRENTLFAHNGRIWPWAGALSEALRARLAAEDAAQIRGTTDSELLLALWRTFSRGDQTTFGAEALRSALQWACEGAERLGGGVSATLVFATAAQVLAIRFARPGPPPTLYLSRHEPRWNGGTVVASEPLDDSARWEEVPPSTVCRIDAGGVSHEPLTL